MADIQFWRSNQMSDTSFLDLVKRTFGKTFTKGIDAKDWLIANGHYTSYPDIVTDGLVLYLDASNLDSFKGEPTTNLFPDITGQSSKYNISQYLGKQDNISGNFIYSTSTHGTYTLSADIRLFPDDTSTNPRLGIYAHYTDTTSNFIGNYNIIKDGKFKRLSATITTNTSKTLDYLGGWIFDCSTPGTLRHCDGFNIQLEQKSYATPFVNGTRGTTYATGGGWCDLSGNGNHGVVNNGEYYDGYLRNSGNISNFFSVDIPDSTSLNNTFTTTTGGWTIEEIIWTNSCTYPEADGGSVISNNGYSSGYGFDWNHGADISYFKFEQIGGGSNDSPVIYIPNTYKSYNTWRIRTMVWNRGTNTNSLYINGTFIESVNTPNTSGQIIYDGGGISLGTLYGWKHYGRRAVLKIYNKVLNQDEITQNFNATRERFGL